MSAFETKPNEANTGSSFNKAEFSPLVHNVVHSIVLWILIFTVLFAVTGPSGQVIQCLICRPLFVPFCFCESGPNARKSSQPCA